MSELPADAQMNGRTMAIRGYSERTVMVPTRWAGLLFPVPVEFEQRTERTPIIDWKVSWSWRRDGREFGLWHWESGPLPEKAAWAAAEGRET